MSWGSLCPLAIYYLPLSYSHHMITNVYKIYTYTHTKHTFNKLQIKSHKRAHKHTYIYIYFV